MKTIEMILVIVLSTIFIIIILPGQESLSRSELKDVLYELEDNDLFRDFSQKNNGCNNSTNQTVSGLIESYLPSVYEYELCIGVFPDSLPDQNIFVESIYFTGNHTQANQKIIRLYYWINE